MIFYYYSFCFIKAQYKQTLKDNRKYERQESPPPTTNQKPPPKTRTVGTQSLYRESEAQTVPYSPDYVLPSDGSVFNHAFFKIFILYLFAMLLAFYFISFVQFYLKLFSFIFHFMIR